MGKRKQEAKALFEVKGDFYESLDAFCQAALDLSFAVKSALDLGTVADSTAPIVRAKLSAFLRAMSQSERGEAA